jgi:hypothetical protein
MVVEVMAMKVVAMESEPDERPEEVGTEVMMVPPAVPMTMMPETPAVNLLDQRRRLCCLQCYAAWGRRCRRGRHHSEAECAGHHGEQYCLPHVCLLHVMNA